jgi:hypothetical protein
MQKSEMMIFIAKDTQEFMENIMIRQGNYFFCQNTKTYFKKFEVEFPNFRANYQTSDSVDRCK